jgi:hypothetical protein
LENEENNLKISSEVLNKFSKNESTYLEELKNTNKITFTHFDNNSLPKKNKEKIEKKFTFIQKIKDRQKN